MRQFDALRPASVAAASGRVLEVGFGTGLNLPHYGSGVTSLVGVDPLRAEGLKGLAQRLEAAPFPVERHALRVDEGLPFDSASFDCILTTWTLCSIGDPARALREMKRVLKPGGRYLFVEHGRAERASLARWQDRLNPIWVRISGGCNMNRAVAPLVTGAGFELERIERFRQPGPAVLTQMFRGSARRSD